MHKPIGPDRILLDQPYVPLNDFIIAERAAGRLPHLKPWDETRTAREAVRALRAHRVSYIEIRRYYDAHPLQLEAYGMSAASLEHFLTRAPYPPHQQTASVTYLQAAMHAWQQFPDREKPIEHTRSENPPIGENDLHKPLSRLIAALAGQIEGAIGQEPLTVRKGLKLLAKNFGGTTSLGTHLIINRDKLRLNLTPKDIRKTTDRLHNFFDCGTAIIRVEDMPVIIAGYRHMASAQLSKVLTPASSGQGASAPVP